MQQSEMKLGIIGLGYAGLTTGVGFAELGYSVLGTDHDQAKLDVLKQGTPPFYEPGLKELLRKHMTSGRLRFVDDIASVVREAPILFICVGTPESSNGQPDLSQVEQAAKTIAQHLDEYRLIVEKSTVPVTTAARIKRIISEHGNGTTDFDVASNPEFLREGFAINDFIKPDRIVVGVESERAGQLLKNVYASFERPILVTDLNTAEIIKHAANSFLATRISFINMVSDLCEATGADVTQTAAALGMDPRIGQAYLEAGLGYGGSCLPKDVRAFIHAGDEAGVDFSLLKAVEAANNSRMDRFLGKIMGALGELRGKTLGVLGLAFKPGTDDIRESPSIKLVERLRSAGATMYLHDPHAMENARKRYPEIPGSLEYRQSSYDAAKGSNALLVLTAWPEYCELDLVRVRDLMATPVIVDGRNILDPAEVRALGFKYTSMGRP